MPLLLTPPQPLTASTGTPVASAYAIIQHVNYDTREKRISFQVGYYYNEQAYLDKLVQLQLAGVPDTFTQPATPAEANAVPIFQFLEQSLTEQLTDLLGAEVTIANVA